METHLFWCQKVKGQGHESKKHDMRGSLHSFECWLLLVSTSAFGLSNLYHKSLVTDAYVFIRLCVFWTPCLLQHVHNALVIVLA